MKKKQKATEKHQRGLSGRGGRGKAGWMDGYADASRLRYRPSVRTLHFTARVRSFCFAFLAFRTSESVPCSKHQTRRYDRGERGTEIDSCSPAKEKKKKNTTVVRNRNGPEGSLYDV